MQSAISEGFTMTHYAFVDDFSLMRFEGADTLTFLQGQLSQDMRLVKGETALLASYSNPKGRVFATFLFWQDAAVESTYYALVRKDIAEFLQKRLRMFVLRAKVSINVVPATMIGFWGTALAEVVKGAVDFKHNSPSGIPQFHVSTSDNTFTITYSTVDEHSRVLVISLDENVNIEAISQADKKDGAIWNIQDILSGIPWIGEQTKELFVAQSINLDAINAINFKKGCYPGQEVIARSHYLGQLKRRSVIAIIDKAIADMGGLLGTDIMQGDTPVGQVVNASSSEGKTYLLCEIQLKALEEGPLTLAADSQATLQIQNVPYPLEKPE